MCGIAGFVGSSSPGDAADSVRRMMHTMTRRGPDSAGIEAWDGAVLGHRRLAIFDLSETGHQPMQSPDGRIGLVFNGAIYNFRALREELEGKGYRFRGDSDTEVLLHGYAAWGIDVLVSRVIGMFAFGIWDADRRTLYLVRDRLGVKPLVYARSEDTIAFASTVRALRAAGLAGALDPDALAEFLEFGYVTDARSVFQGVTKVPAATILEWRDGEVRSRSYWASPEPSRARAPTFAEAVDRTESLFLAAVERRLHADVPVGALLSGGVDSGLVCWAIRRLGADVTAFTVGTPGEAVDETDDARWTAGRLGIRHEVLELDAAVAGVDELVSAYGEPFACASALGMLRISEVVRSGATVLLTGDGGDDVFLGYPQHRFLLMAERLARGIPSRMARGWHRVHNMVPRAGGFKRMANFLNYATGGLGAYTEAHDGLPYYRDAGLLGDRLAGADVSDRTIAWSPESARKVLGEYLGHDLRNQFVAEYLTKVDGATMYYGLEARSPFLDQDLWEYAAALPHSVRLHRLRLKAILRAQARRHLGDRIADGRKRGFSIPVQRWLVGRWRQDFEEAFHQSILFEDGWIRAAPLAAAYERAADQGHAPIQLWYLYVLERWLRLDRESTSVPPAFPHEAQRI